MSKNWLYLTSINNINIQTNQLFNLYFDTLNINKNILNIKKKILK